MRWRAGRLQAVLLALLFVTRASALLEDLLVTPLTYDNVDAGDFLTFYVLAGSVQGSASSAQFVYDVTLRDLNAIAPSDYEVYWIRYQPRGTLPRPPSASVLDLSLVYLYGDFGSTFTTDGTLYTVEALSLGDDYLLEVGVRVLTSVQVGQPVNMPEFVLEWYDAPAEDPMRTRFTGSPPNQPTAQLAQPSVTFDVSSEGLVSTVTGADGTPVKIVAPGEQITVTTVLHLPEGTMTGANLRVEFPGDLLFEAAVVASIESTVHPVTLLASVGSSCGPPADVMAQQIVRRENFTDGGAAAAVAGAAVRSVELPLCTLVNSDRDNDLPDSLTLRTIATVRGDAVAQRGLEADITATFVSNFTSTSVRLGSARLALAELLPAAVSPLVIEGVLPSDVVQFSFAVDHAPTSDADAHRVRVLDATLRNATADPPPHYTVVAVGVDGVPQPNVGDAFANGVLASVPHLPLGSALRVTVTIVFSEDVKAGSQKLAAPHFTLEAHTHPRSAASRVTLTPPASIVAATSTRLLTTRLLDDGGMQTLLLGPSNNLLPFLMDLVTFTYPDCLFVDYVPENEDRFCSSDGLEGLGVDPAEMLDCLPMRITLAASGCLRVDPTPAPVAPRVTLRATLPPEFFNTYPALHSASVIVRDEATGAVVHAPASPDAGPGACGHETYDAATGAYERTMCHYGVLTIVTFGIPPSPSPSPIPLALRQRATVNGASNTAGVVVLSLGILVLAVALLALGAVIFRQRSGQWPWHTARETMLYLKGDPDAIRRRLRAKRDKLESRRPESSMPARDQPSAVHTLVATEVMTPEGSSRRPRRVPLRRGKRYTKASLHPVDSPSPQRNSRPRSRLPSRSQSRSRSRSSSGSSSSPDVRKRNGAPRIAPHMHMGSPQAWSGRYLNPLASGRPAVHNDVNFSTAP